MTTRDKFWYSGIAILGLNVGYSIAMAHLGHFTLAFVSLLCAIGVTACLVNLSRR